MMISTGVFAEPKHPLKPVVLVSKSIKGMAKAKRRADGAIVVQERISGTGHIDAKHIVVEGELSPGNSPGCINFGGDLTFGTTATLVMEIEGLMPCSEYDQLNIAGQLTINNTTLKITLLSGFVPAYGDVFDILDWGSLSGNFGVIDTSAATLPVPLVWDTSQLYITGEVIVGVQQFADGDLAPFGNPDGFINAADMMIAIQLVLGQKVAGPLQYAHGDMNGDGVIDVADLILIQNIIIQN